MSDIQALRSIIQDIGKQFFQRDTERISPLPEIGRLAAAGLGKFTLNDKLDYREFLSLLVELSAADSNIAHAFRNHFVFVDRHFVRGGGGKSLAWIKDEIGQGKLIGVANTELGFFNHGPDTQTALTKTADGELYVSGSKFYATGCLYADYLAVKVKDTRDGGIKNVVISADRDGIVRHDDWDGFGQRLSASGTLDLHHVRVHEHEVIPADATKHTVHYGSSFPQIYLTAMVAGLIQRIQTEAATLLTARKNTLYYLDKEPKADPVYLRIIGELSSHAYLARAVINAAADQFNQANADKSYASAEAASLGAAQAKIAVDQAGLAASNTFFDVLGASSTLRSKGYDAFWRNIRTLSSHNPVDQKAVKVGDFIVNGAKLPDKGYF